MRQTGAGNVEGSIRGTTEGSDRAPDSTEQPGESAEATKAEDQGTDRNSCSWWQYVGSVQRCE